MRWFALAVVAALIISVTWWKVSSRAEPAAPLSTTSENVPADDSATSRRPPPALTPEMAANIGQSIRVRRVETRATVNKTVEAGRNRLVSQFQSERVDGGWAAAREQSLTEHSISSQITYLKVEPKNLQNSCRSTTCRITADFATPSEAEDWVTLFLSNTGTNLSNAAVQTTPNPDGTSHMEIYGLAKQ